MSDQRIFDCGFGQGGFRCVADASPVSGDWFCLVALEDSVISSITTPDAESGSASLNGVAVAAGTHLYIRITALRESRFSATRWWKPLAGSATLELFLGARKSARLPRLWPASAEPR